jgi:hypothetical protein
LPGTQTIIVIIIVIYYYKFYGIIVCLFTETVGLVGWIVDHADTTGGNKSIWMKANLLKAMTILLRLVISPSENLIAYTQMTTTMTMIPLCFTIRL